MKPVIALIGRPNVGKSTLFNRLTRSRDALVADLPGLTRDRHYGEGRIGERPFLVIDTGGFEPVAKEGIVHEMAKQTRQAIVEADVVVFIVDGRQGLTPHDKTITDFLRKSGRQVMLVVNVSEKRSSISGVPKLASSPHRVTRCAAPSKRVRTVMAGTMRARPAGAAAAPCMSSSSTAPNGTEKRKVLSSRRVTQLGSNREYCSAGSDR